MANIYLKCRQSLYTSGVQGRYMLYNMYLRCTYHIPQHIPQLFYWHRYMIRYMLGI